MEESTAAEKALDALLKKSSFIRKKVPKDGACMFRCVAEGVYGSQVHHKQLRAQCVSPFVVGCSDLPWDHYIFELQKVETWGGYLELLALSKMLRVNFVIYSENSPPTEVDQGFPVTLRLAYSGGNHYDIIVTDKSAEVHAYCQGLIYSIIQKITHAGNNNVNANPGPANGVIPESKNIAYECWIAEMRKLETRDIMITKKLLESPQQEYSSLSGYYNKQNPPQQPTATQNKDTKQKKKKRTNKQQQHNAKSTDEGSPTPQQPHPLPNNTKSAWSPNLPIAPVPQEILSAEDLEMQQILAQIEEVEKKELRQISFNQHFPTFKPKAQIDQTETKSIDTPAKTEDADKTVTPPQPQTTQPQTNVQPPIATQTPETAAPKPNAWKTPKNWNQPPQQPQPQPQSQPQLQPQLSQEQQINSA